MVDWLVVAAVEAFGARIAAGCLSAAEIHTEGMVMEAKPGRQHHMCSSRSWDYRKRLWGWMLVAGHATVREQARHHEMAVVDAQDRQDNTAVGSLELVDTGLVEAQIANGAKLDAVDIVHLAAV